jgi:hypothetical protein
MGVRFTMNFLAFGILLAHFLWALLTRSPLLWIYLLIVVVYTLFNFLKTNKYHNTFRRKMQIATWSDGGNPKVMGQVTIDVDSIREKLALKGGKAKDTPLQVVVAKGMAMGVHTVKKNLGRLSLGNLMALPHVDITFQLPLPHGDAGYFTLREVDSKPISQLVQEYAVKEAELKCGKNPTHNLFRKLGKLLPTFIFQMVVRVLMWIVHDMDVSLGIIGLPARPFGFLCVADIQQTGLTDLYGTLNPLLKTTINVQICKATPRVVEHNNEIAIRNVVYAGVVFDHRYADGADGAKIIRIYEDFMANVDKHFD